MTNILTMINKIKVDKELGRKMKAFQKVQEKIAEVPPKEYIPDPKKPNCVIIDIDGTLSIRGDRGVYDFAKCGVDKVCTQVKYLLELVDRENKWIDPTGAQNGLTIIILSGREDFYRDQTNDWLNKHQIPFTKLYMRRGGDRRNDAIVKKEIFDTVISPKFNVFFVIDDRKQVKRMWAAEGLFVFDVNQSDADY